MQTQKETLITTSHGNLMESDMKSYNNSRKVTSNHQQKGQGLSEYLIIVALIAVAAIGVAGFMGDAVSNQMASMAMEISGQDGSKATSNAQSKASAAESNAATSKTLSNFSSNN